MQTQKPSVKLEDWAVVPGPNSGSYQALRPGNLLVGRAFGHQRIEKGKFIFTSPIVRVDTQQRIVETKNTCYSLGEASHEYKAWSRDKGQAQLHSRPPAQGDSNGGRISVAGPRAISSKASAFRGSSGPT